MPDSWIHPQLSSHQGENAGQPSELMCQQHHWAGLVYGTVSSCVAFGSSFACALVELSQYPICIECQPAESHP